ncbi:L-threonate dehydrogenase [Aeromonas molluscorum]|jgi:L-threonate 2-dehydrogenase|uniref:L-threonate dehydrogenase n=1 Tax=Aeromonas molluscorum 848 TaxID=1268236 RepID=R1F1W8_9GAMM|nr:L-threonate dehydrogenase [Aeromonas molluscorum]EOD53832.1 6-phosphogluconate dehydrogenase [Aeromonas molluscorum 848]
MSHPYQVAVIGLGAMGMGAALSCLRAGLHTHGIDLDPAARERLAVAGATSVGADANAIADRLDAVLLLVVNAAQVRRILLGEQGLARRLKPGTAIMISATIASEEAEAIASELTAQGLLVLDAPVSGGAVKAEAGAMTVMAAGPQAAFDRLQPVLEAVATHVFTIGERPGQGSTVKIIHQLLAGVHIAVAAEAMALASRAGVPLDLMYQVITQAAGNSWMFENRMPRVLSGDYNPRSAVDIFVKDLKLVAQQGQALNFPLPLASAALNQFLNASNAGHGQEDDSAVIKAYAGITLPGAKS